MSTSSLPAVVPTTQDQWRQALADLPSLEGDRKIPAFFFAHGSPLLIWPESQPFRGPFSTIAPTQGPKSTLANFLKDFGPALIEKYNPKGLVVFSAHWETDGETLVTDYGDSNPLLYDYYGFPPELYDVKFASKGDSAITKRVIELLGKAGIFARSTPVDQPRGEDGRGFRGPGLDHGVFVPFLHMFGNSSPVPIVQISIDGSLDPHKNWALGKALNDMRSEGYLILSGGLTVHTFQDFGAWRESTADPVYRSLHSAIIESAQISEKEDRKSSMAALPQHPGFRKAHPRAEHFVPIYVAAGAGEEGEPRVLFGQYGTLTFAFGV